ncbi:MAG: ATP-binding cassette domain-containing protein [Gammaproteobacteria bacterium]
MIEAQQLKKSFGKVNAVKEVSFTAADGSITGLLGPNGAGKSTTLRMLYTILKPDSGTAKIDQIDVTKNPLDARRRMGVFTHNPGIYPNLSARENVAYFGKLYGLKSDVIKRRIEELGELLEMDNILDRRAKGFSQGQRTKVALARALIHEPQNILLDEPTNGLDVMATRSLRRIIRALKEQGKCVLFSSHVMQEVGALCDHAVIIADGQIAAEGSIDTLRERTGEESLEDAFIQLIGSERGLA